MVTTKYININEVDFLHKNVIEYGFLGGAIGFYAGSATDPCDDLRFRCAAPGPGNARSRRQTARKRPLTPISALAAPSAVAGPCCPAAPHRRRPRHHGGPSPMNATPRRIQLRRTAGWRKPADAIVVARPSRWGNPVRVGEPLQLTTAAGDVAIITTTPTVAVEFYRDVMRTRLTPVPGEHPDDAAWVEQWRTWVARLRGHDLACWCPLDQACHADVLLELANGRLP